MEEGVSCYLNFYCISTEHGDLHDQIYQIMNMMSSYSKSRR